VVAERRKTLGDRCSTQAYQKQSTAEACTLCGAAAKRSARDIDAAITSWLAQLTPYDKIKDISTSKAIVEQA
jgi:hypothetical protein